MSAAADGRCLAQVCVASTGQDDRLSSFSNYGPAHVDIAAPGEGILSTFHGGHGYMSGTSMAAPHVVCSHGIEAGKGG